MGEMVRDSSWTLSNSMAQEAPSMLMIWPMSESDSGGGTSESMSTSGSGPTTPEESLKRAEPEHDLAISLETRRMSSHAVSNVETSIRAVPGALPVGTDIGEEDGGDTRKR